MFKHASIVLAVSFALLAGCEKDSLPNNDEAQQPEKQTANTAATATPAPVEAKPADDAREIGWDDLVPEEYRPDGDLVEQYNNGDIGDEDPRIIALRAKMKELQEKEPVNEKLNGQKIKLPGFVVPLELDGQVVTEMLLVPYHGACIHVPAPPANQTVYIKTNKDSAGEYQPFDTVWVTGTITIVKTVREIAESGYTINATKIEPYE